MNKTLVVGAMCVTLALVAGCSSPTKATAPTSRGAHASPRVIDVVDPAQPDQVVEVEWPDSVTLPGVYRGYLVNGRMLLQRETDPRVVTAPPSSMRFVLGNPAHGEIAYQPAMLEQEHSVEIARTRALAVGNQRTSATLLAQTNDMRAATEELRKQTVELAKQVTTQAAYIKQLEAKLAAQAAEQQAKAKK